MKKYTFFILVITFVQIISSYFNTQPVSQTKTIPEIQYLSPVPGSKFVTKETTIIIRFKHDINLTTLSTLNFIIEGTKSGIHTYSKVQTDEKNVVQLKPDNFFEKGEGWSQGAKGRGDILCRGFPLEGEGRNFLTLP